MANTIQLKRYMFVQVFNLESTEIEAPPQKLVLETVSTVENNEQIKFFPLLGGHRILLQEAAN